jgi:ribosomal protein S9
MNTLNSTLSSPATDISPVDALWVLIQGQTKAVRKALTKRLLEEEQATKSQQVKIKESLTRAFDELHKGQVKHDARRLFSK